MNKLLLLFLLSAVTLSAQKFEKPDYEKIKANIANKKSSVYYPELMKRFLNADSTLTLEQRRNLYYGYRYQKEYDPYALYPAQDSLNKLMQEATPETIDLNNFIFLCDEILEKDPMNMKALGYKLFVYSKKEDASAQQKTMTKARIIADAFMSSGDGLSKETAFYVTNVSDEYEIINIIGLEPGGSQTLIEQYDFIKLAQNQYNVEGFYFDVSPSMEHLEGTFGK